MMTEKRFKYVYFEDGTEMIEDYRKEYITDMEEATEMLNQLVDENELLKFELKECRENKLFSRRQLEKENEQLKEEIEKYKQSNREAIKIVERYNRLLKELGYDK